MTEKRDSGGQDKLNSFVPLMVGIVEHVIDGRMNGEEFGVFCWLLANANRFTGLCWTNAEIIASQMRKKPYTVKRALKGLTRPKRDVPNGYIFYDGNRGFGGGSYPILIMKYPKAKGGKTNKGDYPRAEAS